MFIWHKSNQKKSHVRCSCNQDASTICSTGCAINLLCSLPRDGPKPKPSLSQRMILQIAFSSEQILANNVVSKRYTSIWVTCPHVLANFASKKWSRMARFTRIVKSLRNNHCSFSLKQRLVDWNGCIDQPSWSISLHGGSFIWGSIRTNWYRHRSILPKILRIQASCSRSCLCWMESKYRNWS